MIKSQSKVLYLNTLVSIEIMMHMQQQKPGGKMRLEFGIGQEKTCNLPKAWQLRTITFHKQLVK